MRGKNVKAIYIFIYMAFATWRVFYNVYLEEKDFSGTQIGIINALIQATIVIIVPVWGIFADKQGIRPTLLIAVLITAALMFFLGDVMVFKWLVFYILIFTVFHHPLGPLIDALAVQLSRAQPGRYSYGNLRLWGSLGWALASVFGGYLFSRIELKYIFPVTTLFFLASIVFLRLPASKTNTIYRPDFKPIRVRMLIQNKPLLFFIGILFMYGVVCSPVNAFINLYFMELKVNNAMIGWVYALQSLSELPFFIIGNMLCKKFGARRVIIISMIVMVIRMFLYGLAPIVFLAVILGLLQGITLSFFLVGVVEYIHKQLPDGRDATAQSLIWGLYFGIGHTIGNLLTGYLKDLTGMIGVMYYFAWIALFVLILSFFFFCFYSRLSRTS